MPFRSARQRRFMWARHPETARKWTRKYGSKPRPKKRMHKQTKRGKK